MSRSLRVWASTDPGCVRVRNEDALCIGEQVIQSDQRWRGSFELGIRAPMLVAVIDGMGGHRGGQYASRSAADWLATSIGGWKCSADGAREWVEQVNGHLYGQMEGRPELAAMGATLAALWFDADAGVSVNVGDARIYRESGGFLELRSDDHVLQVDGGQRLLSQALGGGVTWQSVTPSIREEKVRAMRRYLLCSDGLTDEVAWDDLERLMALPPEQAVESMVDAARQAGGRDNITVALVEVNEGSVE